MGSPMNAATSSGFSSWICRSRWLAQNVLVVLDAHAQRIAIGHRVADETVAGNARIDGLAHRKPIGRRKSAHRRAMKGVPARDDLVGARLPAACLMVLLGDLEGGLDGFRAAADEHHFREPSRRELGDARRQFDHWLGHVAARSDVVEGLGLLVHGPSDLFVAIAKRIGPRRRAHHVEIGLAMDVDDLDARSGRHDHRAVFLDIVARGDRENAVIERVLGQAVGAFDRGFHVHGSLRGRPS